MNILIRSHGVTLKPTLQPNVRKKSSSDGIFSSHSFVLHQNQSQVLDPIGQPQLWAAALPQNRFDAIRAPSAIEASLPHTTSGSTAACPTHVP